MNVQELYGGGQTYRLVELQMYHSLLEDRVNLVEIALQKDVYASILDRQEQVEHTLPAGHKSWLQVVRGVVEVNGQSLRAGDGAALNNELVPTVTRNSDGCRKPPVRSAVALPNVGGIHQWKKERLEAAPNPGC